MQTDLLCNVPIRFPEINIALLRDPDLFGEVYICLDPDVSGRFGA